MVPMLSCASLPLVKMVTVEPPPGPTRMLESVLPATMVRLCAGTSRLSKSSMWSASLRRAAGIRTDDFEDIRVLSCENAHPKPQKMQKLGRLVAKTAAKWFRSESDGHP